MTTLFTWVGYLAGTLTTLAFLPQVLQVWKTKRAEDLHIGTLVCLALGVALWALYGIGRRDLPVIIANSVALVLQCAIIYLKLRYARASKNKLAKSSASHSN